MDQKRECTLKKISLSKSYMLKKTLVSHISDVTLYTKIDCIRAIHKYIYDNNLQSNDDYIIIMPNHNLQMFLTSLNEPDKYYTYFNLPLYIRFDLLI
jgi:hypothetical protein